MDDAPLCGPDDERGCCAYEDEDEVEANKEADKKVDKQPPKKRPKKESTEAWMHDAAAA